LEAISQKITDLTGARFNAILTRLYFDGKDNIAWHTDGRTFLGDEPVIASLSLG
jgi:alkylated DNA repair dioxygenase AlkB